MAKYIEVEKVQEMLENAQIISDGVNCGYCTDDISLDKLPAADVAPVVHAKWAEYENEQDKGFHYCSNCKGQAFNYEDGNEVVEVLAPNCHNCGAKMDL